MSSSSPASSAERRDLVQIEWQWSDAPADNTTRGPEGCYTFVSGGAQSGASLAFEPNGTAIGWTHALAGISADEARWLIDRNRLYVALYLRGTTRCTVVALDAGDGRELWHRQLQGVGSVAHSRYANRVQVALHGGLLVVYGEESVARYIEVLDPTDGRQVFHRRIE